MPTSLCGACLVARTYPQPAAGRPRPGLVGDGGRRRDRCGDLVGSACDGRGRGASWPAERGAERWVCCRRRHRTSRMSRAALQPRHRSGDTEASGARPGAGERDGVARGRCDAPAAGEDAALAERARRLRRLRRRRARPRALPCGSESARAWRCGRHAGAGRVAAMTTRAESCEGAHQTVDWVDARLGVLQLRPDGLARRDVRCTLSLKPCVREMQGLHGVLGLQRMLRCAGCSLRPATLHRRRPRPRDHRPAFEAQRRHRGAGVETYDGPERWLRMARSAFLLPSETAVSGATSPRPSDARWRRRAPSPHRRG